MLYERGEFLEKTKSTCFWMKGNMAVAEVKSKKYKLSKTFSFGFCFSWVRGNVSQMGKLLFCFWFWKKLSKNAILSWYGFLKLVYRIPSNIWQIFMSFGRRAVYSLLIVWGKDWKSLPTNAKSIIWEKNGMVRKPPKTELLHQTHLTK